MNKSVSKVDAMRAMREQHHAERARPPAAVAKPPKSELQREVDAVIASKPEPHVAAKRKKGAAEVASKPRAGKVQIAVWIDAELDREMRIAMAEDGVKKLEQWISDAIRQELKARRA